MVLSSLTVGCCCTTPCVDVSDDAKVMSRCMCRTARARRNTGILSEYRVCVITGAHLEPVKNDRWDRTCPRRYTRGRSGPYKKKLHTGSVRARPILVGRRSRARNWRIPGFVSRCLTLGCSRFPFRGTKDIYVGLVGRATQVLIRAGLGTVLLFFWLVVYSRVRPFGGVGVAMGRL